MTSPYDQASYNYTLSQASTSPGATHEMSDQYSVFSYQSSRNVSEFVQEIGGRRYNIHNPTYALPADDDEWSRLDKQHAALVVALNGLYPEPIIVRRLLRTELGNVKQVLDLGCGTGVWAIEMAKEFPEANVVGVDLAPSPTDPEHIPPNCRFEVDDINLGLTHFYGQFDVIQARFVTGGIHDYRSMMLEVAQCLKPGGIVFCIEGDFLFEEDFMTELPIASEENMDDSWLQRFIYEVYHTADSFNSDMSGMELFFREGLWDNSLFDPLTCRTAALYLPTTPWPQAADVHTSQRLQFAGTLMRQNFLRLNRAWHHLLRKNGTSQDTLDSWSTLCEEELLSLKFRSFARVRFVWGRRWPEDTLAGNKTPSPSSPAAELYPSPIPPTGPTPQTMYIPPSPTPYPFFFVYKTPEKARIAIEERLSRRKPGPVPNVFRDVAPTTY